MVLLQQQHTHHKLDICNSNQTFTCLALYTLYCGCKSEGTYTNTPTTSTMKSDSWFQFTVKLLVCNAQKACRDTF